MATSQVLTFAEFRLDPERGQLLRGGTPVALTPKAFALLEYLAARAGRLVSKQELLDAIWPNVFVGEAVLKGTIRDVRRADVEHAIQFLEGRSEEVIGALVRKMDLASQALDFEKAARLRDQIEKLRKIELGLPAARAG